MIKVNACPANKRHFLRLKAFCVDVLAACREAGAEPVAYGSLVFFGYTRNRKTNVHDIDLLVPEKSLASIRKALRRRKIAYKYHHSWHGMKVFRGELSVELDSSEFWQKRPVPKRFELFDFGGLVLRAVSFGTLKGIYRRAYKITDERPEESRRKYEILKKY